MESGQELRYLILALQRDGHRRLTERLKPLNLTPSQAEVLLVLHQYQPMPLAALGERLVCETGSPSRLVKTLVEAGYIEKTPDPQDGRAVKMSLSAAAEALMPALIAADEEYNQAVSALFAPDDLDLLLEKLWPLAEQTDGGQALLRRKHQV